MGFDPKNLLPILQLYAEENYAHARDHEHLRAQVTSILTAAAIVFVGLALNSNVDPHFGRLAGAVAIALGIQNIWLVWLHNNRFRLHVDKARLARQRMTKILLGREDWLDDNVDVITEMDPCRKSNREPTCDKSDQKPVKKSGNLGALWISVPAIPIVAGFYLLLRSL